MIYFVNILESNNQKYKTNGTVRDDNYKGNFLFAVSDFISFVKDSKSMFLMSAIFLKDNIDGACVPQFKLYYIRYKTNPLHKNAFTKVNAVLNVLSIKYNALSVTLYI